ncbi:MAG: sulfate permease [Myxococcota bacterium]
MIGANGLRRTNLRRDLTAGLTTAVMLIPQAMAYAMLAGLPPIVGLYASTLPLVVYALIGSSRELAVGPVAMVSLLVATALGPMAEAGSADYVAYAIVLSLLVGLLQTAMGLLRAGFLVNFLSHPVVSGFTSAAALIIGFSQLQHLLGVDIPRSHHVHTIVAEAIGRVSDVQGHTLAIGLASIVSLVVMKRFVPRWPRALVVVVGSTVMVWGLGLRERGVAIVGDVPAGLPSLSLPRFDLGTMEALLPTAIIISLVGFMESISVAKAFARRAHYEVDPNRELLGLGLANLAAAVFRGYPVTGGFSRTAVNAQAGARSGVAGLVTAGVVVVTLLVFTDLFFYLPKAVLAAVIMTAVFGLVDVAEVKHLWKADRTDLALLVLTFAATLGLGIEAGIGIGVGASMLWFVVRTTRPHYAVLGRLPGTVHYRNVERFEQAQPVPGILMLRIDASFYYGNVAFLKQTLSRHLGQDSTIRDVILDASGVNRLDSSAASALAQIREDLQSRGIGLYLASVKGPVRDAMQRSGLAPALGPAARAMSVHDAVELAIGSRRTTTLAA